MPLLSEPSSVPDPLADAWDEMVRRNRIQQAGNDPLFGAGDAVVREGDGYFDLLNRADLPFADWRNARSAQLRGVPWKGQPPMEVSELSNPTSVNTVSPVVVRGRAAAPTQRPLTGRPGIAARIAGALNTIVGGANRSASVDTSMVRGTVTRGAGRDLDAQGSVLGLPVGARRVLDPPTGRAEISASGFKGEGIGLPPHVRIYNTPTGELDIDLSGPIKKGPFTLAQKETYYIGAADPLSAWIETSKETTRLAE